MVIVTKDTIGESEEKRQLGLAPSFLALASSPLVDRAFLPDRAHAIARSLSATMFRRLRDPHLVLL